jgi:hypothetical protein
MSLHMQFQYEGRPHVSHSADSLRGLKCVMQLVSGVGAIAWVTIGIRCWVRDALQCIRHMIV